MSQSISLEERLETLGAALRERPSVTPRAMQDVRELVASGWSRRSAVSPPKPARIRWRVFAVAAVLCLAVTALLSLLPSSGVTWAEMRKAIQAQKWIHATASLPNGESGEMWLSPERNVWAFKFKDSIRFYDGRLRVTYQYTSREKKLVKLPLGDDSIERVLPL